MIALSASQPTPHTHLHTAGWPCLPSAAWDTFLADTSVILARSSSKSHLREHPPPSVDSAAAHDADSVVIDTPFWPAVKAISVSWLLSSGFAHAAAPVLLAGLLAKVPVEGASCGRRPLPSVGMPWRDAGTGLTTTSTLPSAVLTLLTLKMLTSSGSCCCTAVAGGCCWGAEAGCCCWAGVAEGCCAGLSAAVGACC